jgi:hypothetical protein
MRGGLMMMIRLWYGYCFDDSVAVRLLSMMRLQSGVHRFSVVIDYCEPDRVYVDVLEDNLF